MRCLVLAVPALLGVAHAQLIDIKGIAKYPAPDLVSAPLAVQKDDPDDTDATPSAAARIRRSPTLVRRDDCSPQPTGAGPVPTPDTADNFLSSQDLANLANNAQTPDGYAAAFTNLHTSLSAPSYMGLSTLNSYDNLGCASLCDQASGCQAFNIYAERDPTQSPGDSCPDPPSTTNFRCTLWGVGVDSTEATNNGQYAGQFHLVIAASNAYNKTAPPAAIADWNGPTELGGAINAPLDSQGRNTYMGYKYHPFTRDQGYDPQTCWNDCDQQTKYNAATKATDGTYQTCVFFDAYVLSKNGIAQGLYCSMYNQTWSRDYGTNYGQTSGNDRYSVSRSYSYSMKNPPNPSTSQPQPKSSSSTTLVTSTTTTTKATPTPSCSLRPVITNYDFEGGVNTTASTPSGWKVPNGWNFQTDKTYGGRSDGSWDISATPGLSSPGSSLMVYGSGGKTGGQNAFVATYSNSGASGFASSSLTQTTATCPGAQHRLDFNYMIYGSYVPQYSTLYSMGWQTSARDSGSGWTAKTIYFTAGGSSTDIYFSFSGPAYSYFKIDSVVLSTWNGNYYQTMF